jgi:hypothetical protein
LSVLSILLVHEINAGIIRYIPKRAAELCAVWGILQREEAVRGVGARICRISGIFSSLRNIAIFEN